MLHTVVEMSEPHEGRQPEAGLYLRGLERVVDGVDERGRPLLERDAPNRLRTGVEFELVSCPYSGGRNGMPMNRSALAAVLEIWPEILSLLAALAERLDARARGPRGLLEVAVAAVAMPGYLCFRHGAPEDLISRIPGPIAGAHKIAAGLVRTASRLVLDHSSTELDAAHVVDEAERLGHFVGVDEVCAAPPVRVREAISIMLGGAPKSGLGASPPYPADPFGDALAPIPAIAAIMADRALLCLAAEWADLCFMARAKGLATDDLLWGVDVDEAVVELERCLSRLGSLPAELLSKVRAAATARLPSELSMVAHAYAPLRATVLELHGMLEGRLRVQLGRGEARLVALDARQAAACPSQAVSERLELLGLISPGA